MHVPFGNLSVFQKDHPKRGRSEKLGTLRVFALRLRAYLGVPGGQRAGVEEVEIAGNGS